MDKPLRVYISYTHKDADLHEQLIEHLKPLQQEGLISIWQDSKIIGGEDSEAQLLREIDNADIILLLITARYLASDFCWYKEMQRAMQNHDHGSACVIPLILGPADWKTAPFSKLQILPRNGQPVTTWEDKESAFQEVVKGIREVVYFLNPPKSSGASISSPLAQHNPAYKVFISYSHKDYEEYQELMLHLKPLQRQHKIEIWSDILISAGSEWQSEIMSHLEWADLFIVLLSPSYLASSFLKDIELKRASERFLAGEIKLLPVNIKSTILPSGNILSTLQSIPERPISNWKERDDAWITVANEIQRSAQDFSAEFTNSSYSPTTTTNQILDLSQYSDRGEEQKEENSAEIAFKSVGKNITIRRFFDKGKACLKADEYAKAIATVMAGATGEVCFALFGHWGRGKTYLMKLVDDKLSSEQYECVWFSAWKYRAKPEIWIHLYETLRRKAVTGDNWLRSLVRKIRIFVVKIGAATVFTFVFLFIVSLMVPFGLIGIILIPIVLIFGIAYSARLGMSILGTWNNLGRITGVSRKTFQIAEHHERLGLQEVIGEDLKLLVTGWVGFGKGNEAYKKRFIKFWNTRYFTCYLILAATLSFVIHSSIGKTNSQLRSFAEFLNNLSSYSLYRDEFEWMLSSLTQVSGSLLVSDLVRIVFPIIVFISMMLFLFILSKLELSKSKILLIVDDLDRLPSNEILEIIESLKLLLEEEIQDLIQVVIICEEKSLKKAFMEKYKGLYEEGDFISLNGLIEENIQKLFISHLRLPPLTSSEQKEILKSFIDYQYTSDKDYKFSPLADSIDDKVSTNVHVGSGNLSIDHSDFIDEVKDMRLSIQSRRKPSFAKGTEVQDDGISDSLQEELTLHEREAIYNSLENLSGWTTLGPRAIQSYVFRYKLARELLKARGKMQIDASYLATALAKRLSNSLSEDEVDEDIKSVLEEVT